MTIERIFIAGIAILSMGCATTPISVHQAKNISADRILAFKGGSDQQTGHIVIIRDTGFLGGGCYTGITINGVLAARLDVGERVDLFVPPGELLIKVGRDPQGKGLCATFQDEWTQRESSIKAGETKFYRASLDANGKFDIFRTDQ